MPSYRQADAAVESLLSDLIDKYHPELVEASVSVEILFANATRDETTGAKIGDAVTLHGWPCAAVVSINNAKNRAAGCADARIILDGDAWPDWTTERRSAVLDHELFHIAVRRDRDGAIKSDDGGRPKLKLRKHDFEIGGFVEIAKRHGPESLEVQAVGRAWATLTQQAIDWDAAELAAAGDEVLAGV